MSIGKRLKVTKFWVYLHCTPTTTYHCPAISRSDPPLPTSYLITTYNHIPLPITINHYPSLPTTTQLKQTIKKHFQDISHFHPPLSTTTHLISKTTNNYLPLPISINHYPSLPTTSQPY